MQVMKLTSKLCRIFRLKCSHCYFARSCNRSIAGKVESSMEMLPICHSPVAAAFGVSIANVETAKTAIINIAIVFLFNYFTSNKRYSRK